MTILLIFFTASMSYGQYENLAEQGLFIHSPKRVVAECNNQLNSIEIFSTGGNLVRINKDESSSYSERFIPEYRVSIDGQNQSTVVQTNGIYTEELSFMIRSYTPESNLTIIVSPQRSAELIEDNVNEMMPHSIRSFNQGECTVDLSGFTQLTSP